MADPTTDAADVHSVPDPPLGRAGVVAGEAADALNAKLLAAKLSEAELLLSYAVETGFQVAPGVLQSVLEAGAASRTGWTEHAATNLLIAESTLADLLKPVSAESLQSSARYRSKSLSRRLALPVTMGVLAAVIVLYSTGAVLFSSFSTSIGKNLDIANPLAVRLVSELGAPAQSPNKDLCLNADLPAASAQGATSPDPSKLPDGIDKKDVILDLQTFAAAIRDMYGGARRMNQLYKFQPDPFTFVRSTSTKSITEILELPPGLPNLALAATERVCVYQRARYYAQSTEESAKIFTGAVATCILPVLYALLGAGAYVLRRLESQLRLRTFVNEAHSPRFITAAIAGAVVGVFNFGQGVSVSPLAIAFLAGYAVDVFFAFLENMIQTLSKPRGGSGSDQATPPIKKRNLTGEP
jgi:hypothetical protein